jgi:hypothetical protein
MSIKSPEIIEEIEVKKYYDYIVGIGMYLYILSDKKMF